ncbi:MAG: radical SAM protein [Spirochaetales bacterium]|nr:radical SAM protein [Spirochaetales bacterium]
MRLTDYSSFYSRFVTSVYFTDEAAGSPALARAIERLRDVPFKRVKGKDDIPPADRKRETLFLTTGRGKTVTACPGSKGHLCCNYLTIDLYGGCPIGCTYCILRSYLNFAPVTVNVDTGAVCREIERIAAADPGRPLRLGTGETGDSLFFDPLFDLSRDLVERCALFPNVSLELKTKTDFVDHLLGIERKGGAVIAFSLNPQVLIDSEEPFANGLDDRLAAAGRALAAGYRVAFHFDPVIRVPGWDDMYGAVADRLAAFPAERVAWISLGTVRYPKELLGRLGERPYLFDEFFPSRDGKFRYLQPVRVSMYRSLADRIAQAVDAPVYMCMESPAVWRRVFGNPPSKIESLCGIFIPTM